MKVKTMIMIYQNEANSCFMLNGKNPCVLGKIHVVGCISCSELPLSLKHVPSFEIRVPHGNLCDGFGLRMTHGNPCDGLWF